MRQHPEGLCAVCHREPRHHGWFDPVYRASDPRRDASRKRLCIRAEDAVWARELVEHCAATLLVQAERHLANNDMERYHKQMLEFVREAGKEGIRHNDLTRKCQFIEPKLRREIIASLIEGEQICSKPDRPPTSGPI